MISNLIAFFSFLTVSERTDLRGAWRIRMECICRRRNPRAQAGPDWVWQAMRQPAAVLSPHEDVAAALGHIEHGRQDGSFDAWLVADGDGLVGHGSQS